MTSPRALQSYYSTKRHTILCALAQYPQARYIYYHLLGLEPNMFHVQ